MKVINFFGGPGVGKSTISAELFVVLKKELLNVELVGEYAKDLTWQESTKVLQNQIYVFGKQHQRMWRLKDKLDYIIADSPLPFSIIYDNTNSETFHKLIMEEFNKYDNFNILLSRTFDYNRIGRYQDEDGAKRTDQKIIELGRYGLKFDLLLDPRQPNRIDTIINALKTEKN